MPAHRWFRNDHSPPLFLAIGMDEDGDGYFRLNGSVMAIGHSMSFSGIVFLVELSVEERLSLIHEAHREGWRLDQLE